MTPNGVVKAAAVKPLSEDLRWDAEMVLAGQGYPWKPVPSAEGDAVPVHIDDAGKIADRQPEETFITLDPTLSKDESRRRRRETQSQG